jgi:hypothetical protein
MRYRLTASSFLRFLLRYLVHQLLEPLAELTVLAKGEKLHPAQLVELPLPRPPPVQPPPEHLLVGLH